jgi:hypothetical protein
MVPCFVLFLQKMSLVFPKLVHGSLRPNSQHGISPSLSWKFISRLIFSTYKYIISSHLLPSSIFFLLISLKLHLPVPHPHTSKQRPIPTHLSRFTLPFHTCSIHLTLFYSVHVFFKGCLHRNLRIGP